MKRAQRARFDAAAGVEASGSLQRHRRRAPRPAGTCNSTRSDLSRLLPNRARLPRHNKAPTHTSHAPTKRPRTPPTSQRSARASAPALCLRCDAFSQLAETIATASPKTPGRQRASKRAASSQEPDDDRPRPPRRRLPQPVRRPLDAFSLCQALASSSALARTLKPCALLKR